MSAAPGRKVTEVAVGVLLRADGTVLLADRPAGKAYAGYWEFPGGKIEPGETVAAALARELHEELGIAIQGSTPWVTFEFDYPHAYVRLHFERVHGWDGVPHAHEGQRLAFSAIDGKDAPSPLLPAAIPALRWLRLPDVLWIDTAAPDRTIVTAQELRTLALRPATVWAGAWIESRADLMRAARLQYDFAVAPRGDAWSRFAALARDTPLPIYAWTDEVDLVAARAAGAHGLARSGVAPRA